MQHAFPTPSYVDRVDTAWFGGSRVGLHRTGHGPMDMGGRAGLKPAPPCVAGLEQRCSGGDMCTAASAALYDAPAPQTPMLDAAAASKMRIFFLDGHVRLANDHTAVPSPNRHGGVWAAAGGRREQTCVCAVRA
jgi:hypothetical protein